MIKMLLIILFIIHYNDAQSSGQRMVFHNGKWKFSGEIREIIISFENNWNVLGVKYSWPEQITPESGKLLGSDGRVLAQGLPMSKTWRLRMEVFFRLSVIERYFMELMVEVLVILDVVAVCQVYGQEMRPHQ